MPKTMGILADGARGSRPRGWSKCRGCEQDILWCTTVDGKLTPFNSAPIVISKNHDGSIEYVETTNVHWATCPKRDQFKGKR